MHIIESHRTNDTGHASDGINTHQLVRIVVNTVQDLRAGVVGQPLYKHTAHAAKRGRRRIAGIDDNEFIGAICTAVQGVTIRVEGQPHGVV